MKKTWVIFRYIISALLLGIAGCAFFQDTPVPESI